MGSPGAAVTAGTCPSVPCYISLQAAQEFRDNSKGEVMAETGRGLLAHRRAPLPAERCQPRQDPRPGRDSRWCRLCRAVLGHAGRSRTVGWQRGGAPSLRAPGTWPAERTVLSTRPRTDAVHRAHRAQHLAPHHRSAPALPLCSQHSRAQPVFPAPHLKANPSQPHSPQGTEPVGPRRGVGSSSGAPALQEATECSCFPGPSNAFGHGAKISELPAQSWGPEVSPPHWAGTWGH